MQRTAIFLLFNRLYCRIFILNIKKKYYFCAPYREKVPLSPYFCYYYMQGISL